MPAWKAIEQAEPEFAGRVRRLFDAGRHKTIATLRADGSPRVSGIRPREPPRNHRHERQSTQTTCLHDEPSGAVTGTQPNVIGTVCSGVLRQAGQPPLWVWPCRSA